MAREHKKVLALLVVALAGHEQAFTQPITGTQWTRIKAAADREGYKPDENGSYWIPTFEGSDCFIRACPIWDRGRYKYKLDAQQPNPHPQPGYDYKNLLLREALADATEAPA